MSVAASRWRALIPPARIAPTWRAATPLILFVVGFPALCVAAEALHHLVLSYRWPLLLAVAIAPWVWWMHLAGWSGLTRGRASVALWSRFTLLALIALLLCEPRAVRSDDALSVMFVVDASASIKSESREQAIRYVQRVTSEGKPAEDEAGLMYFGRNAAVELPPVPAIPLEQAEHAMNVRIDRDATDIATALATAAAVLPAERQGRIVLVSDGVATAGALAGVLDDLRARKIAVDVLPVDYAYDKEVWLERLELPRFVKLGETYEASILAESLAAGEGRLVLRENDKVIHDERVQYPAGKSRFTVPIYLREAGYYEYAATIEPPHDQDSWQNNNVAISYLYLRGRGKVLVVTDGTDEREWSRLAEAMRAGERDVSLTTPLEVPGDALALLPYDAIVLANVPRDEFDDRQLQAIHDAVRQQGTGLLMVGGPNSFGAGAWAGTPVERALPVDMDISQRKVLLNGAVVFVLDRSGSMAEPVEGSNATKQAVANAAATGALRSLFPRDYVGVISFDTQAAWNVPLALNTNPAGAAAAIRRIGPGGGTDMWPALDQAVRALAALPQGAPAVKHVVLMTDGMSSPGDVPGTVLRYRAAKVSLTTIGVGPSVDASLLHELATAAGGQYHAVPRAERLPRVFIHEMKTLRRTTIRDTPFSPVVHSVSPVLKGIPSVPTLGGMVLTTAKDRAHIVLRAPAEEEGDDVDPLLATWRYGVGAAAAFTSDLTTRWAEQWVAWDRYEAFVSQLMSEVSRAAGKADLDLRSFAMGEQGVLLVEDHAPVPRLLQVRAVVQGPRGSPQTVTLEQTGPRRYEARFPLDGEGRYQVMAVGVGDEGEGEGDAASVPRVHGGFVVPYAAEYLRFRSNPIVLRQIAEKTGGRELSGKETAADIYGQDREPKRTSRPIIDWLLVVIACMIPIDVGLRRVQIDWVLIRGLLWRRSAEGDARMSTLLKRKQEVAQSLRRDEPKGAARPVSAPTAPVKHAPAPAAKKADPPPPAEAKPDAPLSMTERLLAAKKRAQDQMRDKDP